MAYNRKNYYKEAIASAIAQTLDTKYYEIILVTNFNPDVEAISEKTVQVLYSNDPPGAAISNAIERSKGDVIALLDDDDQWEKNKLEVVFNLFSTDDQLTYYHNNITFVDQSGNKLTSSIHSISINKASKHDIVFISADRIDFKHIRQMLGWAMDFNNSSICFRKSVFEIRKELIGKVKTSLDTSLFFASLSCGYKLCSDGRKLTRYRVHIQNASFAANNDKNSLSYSKQKFNERRLAQFKETIKDSNIVANSAIYRSIEYLISSIKIDLFWLRPRIDRSNLIKEILNYSRYICFSQITYDAGIICISLLFIFFPNVLRDKYLSRE